MVYTVSITSQGQLTIPIELRKRYALDQPKKVIIEDRQGEIVIKPAPDFFSLMGSVKPRKKPEDWKAVEQAIGDAWIEDEIRNIKT